MVIIRLRQKSLIPTEKPNCFDHKHYKGRPILQSEFVFTVNNGDLDARWSTPFCLSTRMDGLLKSDQLFNQTNNNDNNNNKNK